MVTLPLAVDVGETEPQGGVEHDTAQVTPSLLESLATVAVNCCEPFASKVADVGETATVIN